MTGTGRAWVSANEIRLPSLSNARSANCWPVRSSMCRKPSTATRPFVVPDNVRIASHACAAVTIAGRPAAGPSGITPLSFLSSSTSGPVFTATPLVTVPTVSSRGPSADIFAPMAV